MIQKQYIIYFILILILGLSPIQAQWVQSNDVSGTEMVYSVVQDNDKLFAGSVIGNIFISTDSGVNWVTSNLGDGSFNHYISSIAFITDKDTGTIVFAATRSKRIYRSLDTGKTWNIIYTSNGASFQSLLVDSINSIDKRLNVSSNGLGVLQSTDNGVSWIQINRGLTCLDDYSLILCPDSSGGHNLLLGTGNGTIFISIDHGENWKKAVMSDSTNSGIYTFALVPNPNGGVNVIAGTHDSRILISKDRGYTWDVACTNVNNAQIRSLLVVPDSYGGSNIFAGTAWGYFTSVIVLSTDNGVTWNDVSDNLLLKAINFYSLVLVSDNYDQKYIVAGSEGAHEYGGIWRRPLSEMVTSVPAQTSQILKEYVLKQNYPNPFNPTTRIDFFIPKRSFITLKVFDILGREITTLVKTELEQGNHSEKWDASNYPSGVYFYSLHSENFRETKKLLLQK